MPDDLSWLPEQLAELRRNGLFRARRIVDRAESGPARVLRGAGASSERPVIDFASNDYLNLSRDPRLTAAALRATTAAGTGASASALVTGRSAWHADLEAALARFENQPAALLFPSGYAANVGALCALAGSDDVLFCDRFNHASLVDGCRLSGAKLRVYRHDDLDSLERHLREAAGFRRRFIVTDSVFSMDGDLAPLPELCGLAERYAAPLIVDEAHGTGVFGAQGRGVAEMLGVEGRIAVRIGTLSKALGSLGGFVAGSQDLVDWLWNTARTQMFSTALPPAACAAAVAAVDIVRQEPERRARLQMLVERFRGRLQQGGIAPHPAAVGPIQPVIMQSPGATLQAALRLEEQGFLVAAIRPPTVPRNTSRLRITFHCDHRPEEVDALADALVPL